MSKSKKIPITKKVNEGINSNNINEGKPIYYKNELHYIVYEFGENMLISKSKELNNVYCVKKNKTSVNLK